MPTEQESNTPRKGSKEYYEQMPAQQLIGVLIGKLCAKIVKYSVRVGLFIAKYSIKFYLLVKRGCKALYAMLTSDKAKRFYSSIGRAIKKGAENTWKGIKTAFKYLGKWIMIAMKGLMHGILWCIAMTIKGCKQIGPLCKRFGNWIMRKSSETKDYAAQKKEEFEDFRKNKGFKGLIDDAREEFKDGFDKFMEEDQTEADGDIVDDSILEDVDKESSETDSKAQIFGKKIFSSVKDIVEDKKK